MNITLLMYIVVLRKIIVVFISILTQWVAIVMNYL